MVRDHRVHIRDVVNHGVAAHAPERKREDCDNANEHATFAPALSYICSMKAGMIMAIPAPIINPIYMRVWLKEM